MRPLWPILTGERGEYDLLAGDRRSATRALTAIAATAGSAWQPWVHRVRRQSCPGH